ncbi:MAG: hypothetical protein M3Q45_04725, partial [Chloroflexota bacterium]|nr:hypothetical protein [Chloroflexota bacterium]
ELAAQRAAWTAAATGEVVGGVALGSLIPGPTGAAVNAPLVLTQPDGFSITVTPIDLAPGQSFNTGSPAPGAPAFNDVQINGSPTGCTMQDNAPKPSSSSGGDFYFNQLNNLNGLNGVRFTFSTPVRAFGAFFGDLETSDRGTVAFLRLLDVNGALIADVPIRSTIGLAGGVAAENAQCSLTNVPNVQVAAQGLLPGCGNASTRWVGFVSDTPVAQALVIVGDNDPLPGGRGRSEKLSFMGPAVVRALPPADVTIRKDVSAPVVQGMPFYYTLVVSNTSSTLAAGVVITDNAPSGITFNAVTGPNCQLVNNQVTCNVGTLAAGASATVLVQATANGTAPITNTAFVTATNDAAPANNSAAITVIPQSPPSLNPCATVPPTGGPALVINEILYRQAANGDEWVELYATTPIAGGAQFYITDNESTTSQYRFLLTMPAGGIGVGSYIVIHSITGIDDTSLTDGDGLEYFGAGGGDAPYLNNTGDNITVYAGASTGGTVLDYVAYGSGAAVNGPSTGWSAPNVSTGAVIGQSITAIRSGADTNTGAQWSASGANGTLGPTTLGANNNGKIACNVAIHKTGPSTNQIGAPFDYTLRISNTTGVTLTGVVVTDTQPVGVAFNSVTGAGCHLAGDGFTCTIGTLPPFANGIITVNATANVVHTITNTAFTRAISDSLSFDNRAAHPIAFAAPGAIGDFVYLDANGNSGQDPDETTPLNNVPVTLTLPDGSITTTLTVDGVYAFPNLPPGVYTVTV